MKKLFLISLLTLFIVGCGEGSNTSSINDSNISTPPTPSFK